MPVVTTLSKEDGSALLPPLPGTLSGESWDIDWGDLAILDNIRRYAACCGAVCDDEARFLQGEYFVDCLERLDRSAPRRPDSTDKRLWNFHTAVKRLHEQERDLKDIYLSPDFAEEAMQALLPARFESILQAAEAADASTESLSFLFQTRQNLDCISAIAQSLFDLEETPELKSQWSGYDVRAHRALCGINQALDEHYLDKQTRLLEGNYPPSEFYRDIKRYSENNPVYYGDADVFLHLLLNLEDKHAFRAKHSDEQNHPYQAVPVAEVLRMVEQAGIVIQNSGAVDSTGKIVHLFDIGCGVISPLVFGLLGIRTTGIELDPLLSASASSLVDEFNLKNVRIKNDNAATYAGYGRGNFFYLFNPLSERGFEEFAANLQSSTAGKKITVIALSVADSDLRQLNWLPNLRKPELDRVIISN